MARHDLQDDLHRIEQEIITVRRSIRFCKRNNRPVSEAESALRRLIVKAKRLHAQIEENI